MNSAQRHIYLMGTGDVKAIVAGVESNNEYVVLNAIIQGTIKKIKDTNFVEGIRKAKDSDAVFLNLPLRSVATAALDVLSIEQYRGNDAVIKDLIACGFNA